MSRINIGVLTTATLLLCYSNYVLADDLRISGAASVAGAIINPNKTAIEREIGATLAVTVNGDAAGLRDLYDGRSDVAMVAAPISLTAAAINRVKPGSIDIANVQVVPIGRILIKFVVNPVNSVRSLTAPQIKDILTGKITSWSGVGGADQPIAVVAEAPGLGTRSTIVFSFLEGTDITSNAETKPALVQVVQTVAQLPNALGYGNAASINGAVTVLPGIEVPQPLGLATNGPPNPVAAKLIEAVQKYGAAAAE